MQKLLRRTVTVGKNYALHIFTTYLFALCSLLALLILSLAFDWSAFVWIAAIVIVWCVAGISVGLYALSRIESAREQVTADLVRLYRLARHA